VTAGGAPLPGIRDRATDPVGAVMTRSLIVGVVTALPREAACLTHAPTPMHRPVSVTPELSVCRGGVGYTGAEGACHLLLSACGTALVSWGVAGGLDPALRPGTVVVTAHVVSRDENRTAPVGSSVSRRWAERVAAALRSRVPVSTGPILHTDRILETPEAKRGLTHTGAIAADMETLAVATVAQSRGVPWIAVRAVTDPADAALPAGVLRAVDGSGRVHGGRLLVALARHPSELLALPALARGFDAALRTLRVVAQASDATLLAPLRFAEEADRVESGEVGPLT
jgi:adenosylhomocysteine nucleosidase